MSFEPPHPPIESRADLLRTIAKGFALLPILVILRPFLNLAGLIAMPFVRDRESHVHDPVVPDLTGTAPPAVNPDGSVDCSGCDACVPFAEMSIDERGYFCPGCARALA